MSKLTIRLDDKDNIVIACCDIKKSTIIADENIETVDDISQGHKISTRLIKKGEHILKYATSIGIAKENIPKGSHVHTSKILFTPNNENENFCCEYKKTVLVPQNKRKTFNGYVRKNGEAGTRNIVAVISLSNCAASVAKKIAKYYKNNIDEYENVDGVVALTHTLGCGMEAAGSIPMNYLRQVIVGSMLNPNIGGVLLVSLGCERNTLESLCDDPLFTKADNMQTLCIQQAGGGIAAVNDGVHLVKNLLLKANESKREKVSAEYLRIALQCGGSDSFSSFTANPLVGKTVDKLVYDGACACLSETTEVFSAEGSLLRRARNIEVANKLLEYLDRWKEYAKGKSIQINGEVTPGNMAGGLSNILEKALGSVKKGGSTALVECYDYAQPIKEKGLVFMNAPSYDPVGATAQFASGCTLCLFTTGRGSCLGSAYLPTIKIASNTKLYNNMNSDMDFNAGTIADSNLSIDDLACDLYDKIIAVASGELTSSEKFDIGEDEFIPWHIGVTG